MATFSPYSGAPSGQYKGAIHFHTTESDGTGTPTEMGDEFLARGYDFVNCSDHEVSTADPEVEGLLWISGVEDNITMGGEVKHIICVNTAVVGSTDAQTVIDAVPSAFLAHPWGINDPIEYFWTEANALSVTGYDGIEIDDPADPAIWDELLDADLNVWGITANDSHAVAHIVDRGWIQIFASELTTVSVVAALNAGYFYATKGPALTIETTNYYFKVTSPDACNIVFYGTGGAALKTFSNVTSATYAFQGGEVYVRAVATRISDSLKAFTNAVRVGVGS